MHGIEQQAAARRRYSVSSRILHWLRLPRIAFASVAVLACLFGYHEHQVHVRATMARDAAP